MTAGRLRRSATAHMSRVVAKADADNGEQAAEDAMATEIIKFDA